MSASWSKMCTVDCPRLGEFTGVACGIQDGQHLLAGMLPSKYDTCELCTEVYRAGSRCRIVHLVLRYNIYYKVLRMIHQGTRQVIWKSGTCVSEALQGVEVHRGKIVQPAWGP